MSKRDRTMWDGVEGGTWILGADGVITFRPVGSKEVFSPSPAQEARIRKRFESRERSSAKRRAQARFRNRVMGDLGLTLVRGAVSGRTHWE